MIAQIETDVYNQMKNDAGTVGPGGVVLDPYDVRTLISIMGITSGTFHEHVMSARPVEKLEDILPCIQFSASLTNRMYKQGGVWRVSLEFIVFSNDRSYVEIGAIARRIVALFDGEKAGKILFNACPLQAVYVSPFILTREYSPGPTTIDGIFQEMLSFEGAEDEDCDLMGRFKR